MDIQEKLQEIWDLLFCLGVAIWQLLAMVLVPVLKAAALVAASAALVHFALKFW